MTSEISSSQTFARPESSSEMNRKPYSTGDLTDLERNNRRQTLFGGDDSNITRSESGVIKQVKATWWTSTDGDGPTLFGNAWRVVQTAAYFGKDFFNKADSPSHDAAILQAGSKQITSTILIKFLDYMQNSLRGNMAYTFLPRLPTNADDWSGLRKNLLNLYEISQAGPKHQKPWVIPLILESQSMFKSDHIVTIVIRNNDIFYFDSTGRTCDKFELFEGCTLRSLVDLCSEIFRPNIKTAFHEFNKPVQWDVNNCGVYVALFAYHCLMDCMSFEQSFNKLSTIKDIYAERKFIYRRINQEISPDQSNSDSETNIQDHSDDFDIE